MQINRDMAANIAIGAGTLATVGAGAFGGYKAHQAVTDGGDRDGWRAAGSVVSVGGLAATSAVSFAAFETFMGNGRVADVISGIAGLTMFVAGGAALGVAGGLGKNGVQDGIGALRG